ncbi:DUF1317 family protein [Escherichia coli]
MTHTQDEIRVGAVRLPWLKEKNGWLLPWDDVVTNPLKAQRLAEELNESRWLHELLCGDIAPRDGNRAAHLAAPVP